MTDFFIEGYQATVRPVKGKDENRSATEIFYGDSDYSRAVEAAAGNESRVFSVIITYMADKKRTVKHGFAIE